MIGVSSMRGEEGGISGEGSGGRDQGGGSATLLTVVLLGTCSITCSLRPAETIALCILPIVSTVHSV
jgi:hypothetical protein